MVVFGHEEPEEVDRKENIEQLPVGETNRKKLVNICKTRRVARVEAFEVFHQVLPAVSQTFENISSNSSWNAESRQKTSSLLLSLTQFQFLLVMIVVSVPTLFACASYSIEYSNRSDQQLI